MRLPSLSYPSVFPTFSGFDDIFDGLSTWEKNKDHFECHFKTPGIKKEDIKINVESGIITVSASHGSDEERIFRKNSYFYQTSLPGAACEDDLQAEYENGILTLKIPISSIKKAGKVIPIK